MKRRGIHFLLFGYYDLLMTTMSGTVVFPEGSGMYTKWVDESDENTRMMTESIASLY